jgi:hypothetical protein
MEGEGSGIWADGKVEREGSRRASGFQGLWDFRPIRDPGTPNPYTTGRTGGDGLPEKNRNTIGVAATPLAWPWDRGCGSGGSRRSVASSR